METHPLVTIIIPCRNEEESISECLDSIIAQGYPKEKLEVLVVDGRSEDRTREIVGGYAKKYPFVLILDNEKKYTPFALNIGVKAAKGDYIIRMDAHARYKEDYVSKCVESILRYGADNVGGVTAVVPKNDTLMAKAIALSLASPFGGGGVPYKGSAPPAPVEVDTVFCGSYKKEIFSRVGFFNENLTRSQDIEFNLRLKKSGAKIMLCPGIESYYYPKSNLKDFLVHNFHDGVWAVYPMKFIRMPLKPRHYVPLAFVLSLAILAVAAFFWQPFVIMLAAMLILYLATSLFFSVKVAIKAKDLRYILVLPAVFAARHFGYGFGSVWGLAKLAF